MANPTPRQGKDYEWRHYENISPIVVGECVVIMWGNQTKLLDQTVELLSRTGGFGVAMTTTSPVAYIGELGDSVN